MVLCPTEARREKKKRIEFGSNFTAGLHVQDSKAYMGLLESTGENSEALLILAKSKFSAMSGKQSTDSASNSLQFAQQFSAHSLEN